MEGCPGAAGAMDLGIDFLTAKIVDEVDAVEADPVKGAGVEVDGAPVTA